MSKITITLELSEKDSELLQKLDYGDDSLGLLLRDALGEFTHDREDAIRYCKSRYSDRSDQWVFLKAAEVQGRVSLANALIRSTGSLTIKKEE